MRISRDYVFDMIDLVGRSLTTARKKPATMDFWLDPFEGLFGARFEKELEEARGTEDEWGLFEGSSWKEPSSRTDLARVAPGAQDFQMSPVEKEKAEKNKHFEGDSISCRLWEIQRQLSFKLSSVRDCLKDLQILAASIATRWISPGWGSRIRTIIDEDGR